MDTNEIEKLSTIIQKELANRKVYEGADAFITEIKGLAVYGKELRETIASLENEKSTVSVEVNALKDELKAITSKKNDALSKQENAAELIIKNANEEARKIVETANSVRSGVSDALALSKEELAKVNAQIEEAKKVKASIEASIEDTKRKLSGILS